MYENVLVRLGKGLFWKVIGRDSKAVQHDKILFVAVYKEKNIQRFVLKILVGTCVLIGRWSGMWTTQSEFPRTSLNFPSSQPGSLRRELPLTVL